MPKILPQEFYNRSTLEVAQDLLGCFLVRNINGQIMRAMIVETEAYMGHEDKASHASRGKTDRNAPMFMEPGTIYVYLVYGMHSMLNIVTEEEDYPAAVLIRAVDLNAYNMYRVTHNKSDKESKSPIGDLDSDSVKPLANGPAKLTKILRIDRMFNRQKVYTKKHNLWIEDRVSNIEVDEIVEAKRVGIDYAGEYRDKPWRFYIKDNKNVSKKK